LLIGVSSVGVNGVLDGSLVVLDRNGALSCSGFVVVLYGIGTTDSLDGVGAGLVSVLRSRHVLR
jgi:hypothetical protein